MGVNSKCVVQSKRRCESHEPCVCIIGFSTCGGQKKSIDTWFCCCHNHSLQAHPPDRQQKFLTGAVHAQKLMENRFPGQVTQYKFQPCIENLVFRDPSPFPFLAALPRIFLSLCQKCEGYSTKGTM